MAITARLPVILALVICLILQDLALGQQVNKSNIALINNSPAAVDPRVAELIANAKNNQNLNCGSTGPSLIPQQQSGNVKQSGLQQFLNLQQPHNPPVNVQPLTLTLQPNLGNNGIQQQPVTLQQPQNIQQCQCGNLSPQHLVNIQQPQQTCLNVQPNNVNQLTPQQCLNIQQQLSEPLSQSLNLQTQNVQPASLQQLVLQQQSSLPIPINNLQIIGPQNLPTAENTMTSLPVINGQIQGLPSQVSQGVLLSNLGLSSNLPSLLSGTSSKCTPDQSSIIYSENNIFTPANIPMSFLDVSQNTKSLPISVSPMTHSLSECAINTANPTTPLFFIPITEQNTIYPASIQPELAVDCPLSIQLQPSANQIPMQNLQPQLIQQQITPIEPAIQVQPNPIPITPSQNIQNQQNVPLQSQTIISQNSNQSPLTSLLMSQMQPLNSPPPSFPTSSSKSSSMKALLPLLFNLLKEKNGCGYPPNCCGCMNGNPQECNNRKPCMNNNNFNNHVQEPENKPIISIENEVKDINTRLVQEDNDNKAAEIITGYSNQSKCGQGKKKENLTNCVDSEEIEVPKKNMEKKKYETYNKMKYESFEEDESDDDYPDSYED